MACKKMIWGIGMLSSLFVLASCNPSSSSFISNIPSTQTGSSTQQKNAFEVVLNTGSSNADEKRITLSVSKGSSIESVLSKDAATKKKVEDATRRDDGIVLDGWYLSSESSADLDRGNQDQNIFTFSEPVTSDLNLFAGYVLQDYDAATKDYIARYLGVYEELGYSPLPVVRTAWQAEIPDFDSTLANNSLTFSNVSQTSYDAYVASLSSSYGFTQTDAGFTDPLKVYNLALDYDASEASLTLTYTFLDEEEAFPTNFVSSQFFNLDTRPKLNDNLFMLAENVLPEGQKKFVTRLELPEEENATYRIKDVYYVPKSTTETPTTDFYNLIDDLSLMTLSKATDSSTGNMVIQYATDETNSTYLLVSQVTSPTLEETALGVTKGMVKAQFLDFSSRSLKEDEISQYFAKYLKTDWNEGHYGFPSDLKGFGSVLAGTLGGKTVVGFSAVGINDTNLQSFFDVMKEKGWDGEKNSSTDTLTQYQLNSKENEYGIILNYYPKTATSFDNMIQVFYYHQDNIVEDLKKWFAASNVGGGTVETIPLFDADGVYSSGNLTSNGNEIGTGHYLAGTKVKAENVATYEAVLVKEGWIKNEEETQNNKYPTYDSKDGFYKLILIYSLENETLGVQILYNGTGTATDSKGVLKNIGKRLGVDDTFVIPGLEDLIQKKTVETEQFYNLSDNRAYVIIPLSSEDEVTQAKESFNTALKESGSWAQVGTVGSSGAPAYQDSKTKIVAFALDATTDNTDGSKSYAIGIVFYRNIA